MIISPWVWRPLIIINLLPNSSWTNELPTAGANPANKAPRILNLLSFAVALSAQPYFLVPPRVEFHSNFEGHDSADLVLVLTLV